MIRDRVDRTRVNRETQYWILRSSASSCRVCQARICSSCSDMPVMSFLKFRHNGVSFSTIDMERTARL
jgi:hypothetical protein